MGIPETLILSSCPPVFSKFQRISGFPPEISAP
jgi:hypothetical protein